MTLYNTTIYRRAMGTLPICHYYYISYYSIVIRSYNTTIQHKVYT